MSLTKAQGSGHIRQIWCSRSAASRRRTQYLQVQPSDFRRKIWPSSAAVPIPTPQTVRRTYLQFANALHVYLLQVFFVPLPLPLPSPSPAPSTAAARERDQQLSFSRACPFVSREHTTVFSEKSLTTFTGGSFAVSDSAASFFLFAGDLRFFFSCCSLRLGLGFCASLSLWILCWSAGYISNGVRQATFTFCLYHLCFCIQLKKYSYPRVTDTHHLFFRLRRRSSVGTCVDPYHISRPHHPYERLCRIR